MERPLRLTRTIAGYAVTAAILCGCGGGGRDESDGPGAGPGNRSPVIQLPNPNLLFVHHQWFEYDALQGGRTFLDPDGDPLTVSIQILEPARGVTVSGTRVVGPATDTGTVVVWVSAQDATNPPAIDVFEITIRPNSAPVVERANPHHIVTVADPIDFDVLQGGATFIDNDGDAMTYDVTIIGPNHALTITGTRVSGSMPTIGSVRVQARASDPSGVSVVDEFSIAARAPEPGRPTLPANSFVYSDAQLPLPLVFREMRTFGPPFLDTTPAHNETTNEGATLGRVLFYDRRLSITNTHACGSCHEQASGFGSGLRFDTGVIGIPLSRHAMALSNVRYNIRNSYFSDERVAGLEALVLMPISSPLELGMPLELLEQKLTAVDYYPALFQAAFGTPEITLERISLALAQFLRSLITYQSRFDVAFLSGTPGHPSDPRDVFTEQEMRGHDVFIFSKCHFCHRASSHSSPQPTSNGLDETITDPGTRENVGWFRSASIRNVSVSAPFMHDGRFASVREVIDHYDHGVKLSPGLSGILEFPRGSPLRLDLAEEDKAALEAFLNTLTDLQFLTDPKFSDPFQP